MHGTNVSEMQQQNDDKLESPFNRTHIFFITSKQSEYLKLSEKIQSEIVLSNGLIITFCLPKIVNYDC